MGDNSILSVHIGRAILRAANEYATLPRVVLEEIQNAIDALATLVSVRIDYRTRTIIVRDNGEGVSKTKLDRAINLVGGGTIKTKDKLGRFGIGVVSPLGKCERFTFTSTPKSDRDGYLEWTFVTSEIAASAKDLALAPLRRADLYFASNGQAPKGKNPVPWRTSVIIEKFTADEIVSNIDLAALEEEIVIRYSKPMRRIGTVVELIRVDKNGKEQHRSVTGSSFTGTPLEERTFDRTDAGKGSVRLYLAKRTHGRRVGRVSVSEMGSDFRLPFREFTESARAYLETETIQGLCSGVFEGEIVCSRIELATDRKRFLANDALAGLCEEIDRWYIDVGVEKYQEACDQKREHRLQDSARRSLTVLNRLLQSALCLHFKSVVDALPYGSVGGEHVIEGSGGRQEDSPSLSIRGGKKHAASGGDAHGNGAEQLEAHYTHRAYGTRGQRRYLVRGGCPGLAYLFAERAGSMVWEFDAKTGVLMVNITHPLFTECEAAGIVAQERFQEHLMIQALTIEHLKQRDEILVEHYRKALDQELPGFVFCLLNGDAIAGRGKSRKK